MIPLPPLRRPRAPRRRQGFPHLPGLPRLGRSRHRGGVLDRRGVSPGSGLPGAGDFGGRPVGHHPPARLHPHRTGGLEQDARRVTYAAGSRAMAAAPSGDRRLVELRGVDAASSLWPARWRCRAQREPSHRALSARPPTGAAGAAVEPALLDRLHLKLGDRFISRPTASWCARARPLMSEPDRIGRFALGPRILTNLRSVQAAGLLQPGGLYSETARHSPAGGGHARQGRQGELARRPCRRPTWISATGATRRPARAS